MVRNGEFGMADVKRVLWKRWWILPVCAVGCGALAVLVATQLPKKYTSQTLVLVAKPTVPTDYVKPVVTEDLNQRLASMKEQILSRTRLEPVIEKLDLYHADRGKFQMEDLIERLRKAIEISPLEPMPGTQDRSIPGFSVNVTFDDPRSAQQICTEITSMFMEQNARALEQQAVRTTSFIGRQLKEAKADLDEQDAKLAQFKRKYIGSLPEETQANLSLLATLNSQLEANTQALSQARQDTAFNASLLSQEEANWKSSHGEQNSDTLAEQLRVQQDQLTVLESRYTAEHPDVIKAKNQIMELKKRIEETRDARNTPVGSQTPFASPQIQQLRARLRQDEINIGDLTKLQAQIQDQIRLLQGRIQTSPMVEQQLKELTRNYQSALDFYNDLLKKQQNSAMATDLAHQQEGEQFRVLDPPSLPIKPSFPKRSYFAGGGLGGGITLGLTILYLLIVMDRTLHTEKDVETYLKLPVLTSLPLLEMLCGKNGNGEYLKSVVVEMAESRKGVS
jgi:polysaccharide chain length determinant protein (PEP-CTERM system associated)